MGTTPEGLNRPEARRVPFVRPLLSEEVRAHRYACTGYVGGTFSRAFVAGDKAQAVQLCAGTAGSRRRGNDRW